VKKFLVILIAVIVFCFVFNGLVCAEKLTKEDIKSMPRVELELKRSEIHENRIAIMRNTKLDGPRILAEEIDFFGGFLDRMLKTANAIAVFDRLDKAYLGLEFAFLQRDKWDIIWGFLPENEQDPIITYGGIEIKEIPLIGSLGEIFKRLDLALVYCSDGRVKVAASYQWRDEVE